MKPTPAVNNPFTNCPLDLRPKQHQILNMADNQGQMANVKKPSFGHKIKVMLLGDVAESPAEAKLVQKLDFFILVR